MRLKPLSRFLGMADSDNLPPYPSHGNVTRAQQNTAKLARAQIRQNEPKTIAMESSNNDRVLAEVIAAEEDGDAFEDASPLPSADGTDDSDFYDAPHEK
ncbi:hypothetical protein GN244_ATG04782 [Phytophthora infestans]|uniref:Uncharacterized protein n=1 Tax=Phytophthora infestans TaxID=4787 RepID=A0A833T5Q5_PHYIN|nr:hypothetical protein GN244_ATG04782 [Phytophthora infestans]